MRCGNIKKKKKQWTDNPISPPLISTSNCTIEHNYVAEWKPLFYSVYNFFVSTHTTYNIIYSINIIWSSCVCTDLIIHPRYAKCVYVYLAVQWNNKSNNKKRKQSNHIAVYRGPGSRGDFKN